MSTIRTQPIPTASPSGFDPVLGDEPTGELSRLDLKATLTNALDHARLAQRYVAVIMVVLVRPDKLDALLGVPTTDIMRRALKRLPTGLRPADRFVQMTDEKICVILPNLKSETQAWLAASKIQRLMEEPFSFDNSVVTVRPVVGLAYYPAHAKTAEELIVNADIAKTIARSRDLAQHMFQTQDRKSSEVYSGLEALLREALRTNQLEVHYQPQVNLKSGECNTVEALLRWEAPDRGVIEPSVIVRVAEAHGLIGALTSWVLNTALRHQHEWKRDGINLSISINLSTINLTDTDLPDVIAQSLGTWQTTPGDITLEITESSTIGDMDQSLAILQRMRDMGLRLSVDDFGTGYSSLSYVRRFPLNELKIDRSFIQHMRQSKQDEQIVRSVIDLGHTFELSVVAEGVEDEATMKELKRLGCDYAQGYFISRAMRIDALRVWLKKHHSGK
jgi:diguanylate cyclase